MKYPKKVEQEIILQNSIKNEKEKLQKNIELYRRYLFTQDDVILIPEETLEANKLYGTVIGTMFKNFYGCNSTELKNSLRKQYGVKIPENDIMYVMNTKHLDYYHTMLQSMNKFLDRNPTATIDTIIKIANAISNAVFDDFVDDIFNTEDIKPFDDLIETIQDTMQIKTKYSQMTLEEVIKKRKK